MIQWIIIRNVILYEEHVRINLFSNTNASKNSVSTVLSRILFFVVCLHWFSKQSHHSHPFMQQQLLRSRDSSSNLIGRPMFLLCETEKICQTGRKKKHTHFRCMNIRALCGSILRKLLFYSSASSQSEIRFRFFALSVERPLHHYSHAHNSERVVYIQSKFTCQTICHASNHRPRAALTIPVYDTFCECSL